MFSKKSLLHYVSIFIYKIEIKVLNKKSTSNQSTIILDVFIDGSTKKKTNTPNGNL